ncbi:hypothetical protein I7I48_01125 [Histoplasma ohiense]|nr:hypothetical protein I7I48_01125 [Histoplasma ohiense (nom. inval.)]
MALEDRIIPFTHPLQHPMDFFAFYSINVGELHLLHSITCVFVCGSTNPHPQAEGGFLAYALERQHTPSEF